MWKIGKKMWKVYKKNVNNQLENLPIKNKLLRTDLFVTCLRYLILNLLPGDQVSMNLERVSSTLFIKE